MRRMGIGLQLFTVREFLPRILLVHFAGWLNSDMKA